MNNETRVKCSDNPKYLRTLLEQLSYLKNTRNKKFEIVKNDAIFDIQPADGVRQNITKQTKIIKIT